jgi:DNA-binding NtrC family response regulator
MSLHILIVEDLFIEANDLRIILERAGHVVTGMPKSVDQALAAIKRERPDIVLLDIFLKGDLTGIHLAKQLAPLNIPFIYLSANSNASTLEAAKATQPYGFLVKPYRQKDILVALDIATHRHRHAIELTRRQERWLGSLLDGIIKQVGTQEQKLLLLAQAFKTFIPFDILFIDMDQRSDALRSFFGCRREDFEHFVPVDLGELLAKLRLSPGELMAFREAFPYRRQTSVVNVKELESGRTAEKLQKYFEIRSALSVPVTAEKDKSISIFFFSTQPDSYTLEHVEVLNPLKNLLGSVVESIRTQENVVPVARAREKGVTPAGALAGAPEVLNGIIGKSAGLLHVLDQAAQVAPFDSTVLIAGETGVGKEGLAAAIHDLSPRNRRPYIKVNCAAIPETLIESELFGHERGAFTTALERRIGKFEQANGGTIFLDEIGELPLPAQTKLLRVLQEKEVERVGGGVPIKVDVRIVAATNRNLYKEVAEGRFRMDLYYRLNVFPITIPPLRERKEDIPLLVDHFLKFYAAAHGGRKTLSPELITHFIDYSWPGNIRELQYMIERCVVQTRGPMITEAYLPEEIVVPAAILADPGAPRPGSSTEKAQILEALTRCGGKVSGKGGAAELLGMNPNTLTSRMKKLDIQWKYILK